METAEGLEAVKTHYVKPDQWEWLGWAGHHICSDRCRFHLTTRVGAYVISTVGGFRPTPGAPFDTVGSGRLFETYVFKCGARCDCSEDCGAYKLFNLEAIDSLPAQTGGEAQRNHMTLCQKWARK